MKKIKKCFVSCKDTARQAIAIIDKSSLQIALVVQGEKLKGVITDGDIRRSILRGETLESPVEKIMEKKFKFLPETYTSQEALAFMELNSLKHVPILDKRGRIIDLLLLDELIKSPSQSIDVIIMAGGAGKRLGSLTKNCPKPMLLMNEKPILEIILQQFIQAGFKRFYFSVYYLKEKIKKYFKDGSKWNIEIHYLEEDKPLGTAGSLSLLPDKPSHPVLVVNGDVLTKIDYNHLLQFQAYHKADILLCVREHISKIPYGIVKMNDLDVQALDEKPTLTHFINAGIYMLNPRVLDFVPKNTFFDMPDLIKKVIEKKLKIKAFPIHEYWQDIGTPKMLNHTKKNY